MWKLRWRAGGDRGGVILRRSRLLTAIVLSACVGACADLEDQTEVSVMPQIPPPPRLPPVPSTLSIPVLIDGVAAPPITGELLNGTKPDYASRTPAREMWEIPTILEIPRGPIEIIVEGTTNVSFYYNLEFPDRMVKGGVMPMLVWRRRGDALVMANVDPKDPFPGFHQRGGMQRRLGDPLPRMLGVTRLRINRIKAITQ